MWAPPLAVIRGLLTRLRLLRDCSSYGCDDDGLSVVVARDGAARAQNVCAVLAARRCTLRPCRASPAPSSSDDRSSQVMLADEWVTVLEGVPTESEHLLVSLMRDRLPEIQVRHLSSGADGRASCAHPATPALGDPTPSPLPGCGEERVWPQGAATLRLQCLSSACPPHLPLLLRPLLPRSNVSPRARLFGWTPLPALVHLQLSLYTLLIMQSAPSKPRAAPQCTIPLLLP